MFKQVFEPMPDRMNIGLSLSMCIKDLVDRRITTDKVACIISGTSAHTDEQWEYVLKFYSTHHWLRHPKQAAYFADHLRKLGLIIQPRQRCDTCTYNIAEGHWLVQE